MAGRPMMERLVGEIEAKDGGEDYIFDRMADGVRCGSWTPLPAAPGRADAPPRLAAL